MKPIHIYYIIPDFLHWQTLAYPTLDAMKESGVWDVAEKITIGCHYNPNSFIELKEKYSNDPRVNFYHNPNAITSTGEMYCNYQLQQDAISNTDSYYILRGHVKGVTWIGKPDYPGVKAWADNMVNYNVKEWQSAIQKLDEGYDCVGIHWRGIPWPCGHFAGTWWWATSDYIRKLPEIKQPHTVGFRTQFFPEINGSSPGHDAEVWIGTGNPKAFDMMTNSSNFCPEDLWAVYYAHLL